MDNQEEKGLQIQKSLPLLPSTLRREPSGEFSLSVYRGELHTKVIIDCAKKIKLSFPNLPAGFYDIFNERLKANDFCNERLQDAVNHVIDTCVYPLPTIAQFIGFDRRIKVLKYEEYLSKIAEFGAWIGKDYQPITFPDQEKPVWIHVNDIKKYNLKNDKRE